jgi:hypothetical protein
LGARCGGQTCNISNERSTSSLERALGVTALTRRVTSLGLVLADRRLRHRKAELKQFAMNVRCRGHGLAPSSIAVKPAGESERLTRTIPTELPQRSALMPKLRLLPRV